jgi:phosphoglycolate phosphatase-like HAD superfamily hydrolase
VGDRVNDVEAALAAGCTPVLVRTGHGRSHEGRARAMGARCVTDDLASLAAALTGGDERC